MTDNPFAAYTLHALIEEIRARACAVVVFSPEDVFERFDGATADAVAWLEENSNRLEERMTEHGNQVLDDLLMADGKLVDEYAAEENAQRATDAGYSVEYDDTPGALYPYTAKDPEGDDLAYCQTEDQAYAACVDCIDNGRPEPDGT